MRADGRLAYAVCSLEPEEGPDVVADVATRLGADIEATGTWTPENDGHEGFYFALLRPDRRRRASTSAARTAEPDDGTA